MKKFIFKSVSEYSEKIEKILHPVCSSFDFGPNRFVIGNMLIDDISKMISQKKIIVGSWGVANYAIASKAYREDVVKNIVTVLIINDKE